MKKIILIGTLAIALLGCKAEINNKTDNTSSLSPFKEYNVLDNTVTSTIENDILNAEVRSKGLDPKTTSTHLISFVKLGSYGVGEVKVLGYLTKEKFEEINSMAKANKRPLLATNIANYSVRVEYSYKTKLFTWNLIPQQMPATRQAGK